MSLSDKRRCSCCGTLNKCKFGDADYDYKEKEVKEFIKELKEETFKIIGYENKETMAIFHRLVDKLAGEKLI